MEISEQSYEDLLQCTHGWIWEVDAKGVYTYSIPQVADILGYAAEERIPRD
jgi:PAS domain-containing protein